MLISSFAFCRVKLWLSLTAVVVSLQFLVFVADQVWFQDDVVKDCATEKIAGIVKDLCPSISLILQIVALYTLFLRLKRRPRFFNLHE